MREERTGILTRMMRLAASFLPLRMPEHRRFTPTDACVRTARGNVDMMLGRVMFDEDVEALGSRVSSYVF